MDPYALFDMLKIRRIVESVIVGWPYQISLELFDTMLKTLKAGWLPTQFKFLDVGDDGTAAHPAPQVKFGVATYQLPFSSSQ